MALALAASGAASEMAVCSLPASALYIQEGSALVPCGSSTVSAKCQTACSCRRLENDRNVYGVCINSSTTFDCAATLNATRCAQASSYLGSTSVGTTRKLASNSGGGLKTWEWALIGLAIAFVVGLLVFVYNWFKHRPQPGDNRREVVQSLELSRSQPKGDVNVLPVAMRESQTRTATSNRESAARSTTRSHDTNPSQISGFSGGSYHTYAGNPMSSTLTDTEIVTQHQERVFSPISDASRSVGSSEYSQGVDATMTPNAALLAASREQGDSADSGGQAYPSFSSYSMSSDMDSFSSELSVEGGSDMETSERAPYPRKKSIEF
ncbi:hypothetical protein PR002_g15703 [Phytophthora rubi]|uniref:Uncharacterized protein n=1 Tax=Phytophthora rubi TaxID=129364 RepID=A0A6A3KPT1_9STRA|nr:hypothetical protein PR002_g15703 [Phytophthora rubi]